MSQQLTANNQSVIAAGAPSLPLTGSISFLINPQFLTSDGADRLLFEQANAAESGGYMNIWKMAGGDLAALWNNGSASTLARTFGGYSFPQNTWFNVLATWQQGVITTLYLAGAQVATIASCNSVSLAGKPLSIGNNGAGSVFPALAKYSRFGVWSRILTTAEISLLNAGAFPSSIPSGLFMEYDLVGSSLAAQAGTAGTLVATGTTVAADPPAPVAANLRVGQAAMEVALASPQPKASIGQAVLQVAMLTQARAQIGQTYIEAALADSDAAFFGTFVGFFRSGSFGGGTPPTRRRVL